VWKKAQNLCMCVLFYVLSFLSRPPTLCGVL